MRAAFDALRLLDLMVRRIEMLERGATVAAGVVTLTNGATTTVVEHFGVSSTSHIDLEPTNAAMATEWATTRPYVSSAAKGTFTITHANAGTTRTLSYAFRTNVQR